jgi:hypothetical protein
MKRVELLLLQLFSLIPYAINGQDIDYDNRTLRDFAAEMRFIGSSSGGHNESGTKEIIEGSEYLNDKFVEGEVFTQSSKRFSGIPMRYNAYLDEIEVKLPDGKIYKLSNTSQIIQVNLNNEVLIFSPFIYAREKKNGFLFRLYSGKSALYKRNYKIYKGKVPSNGIIEEIPAKIVDKPKEYFIKLKDGVPLLCKTKKDLLEMLRNHLSEIEVFLKRERLKMNNEADLIKVLTYYDSL